MESVSRAWERAPARAPDRATKWPPYPPLARPRPSFFSWRPVAAAAVAALLLVVAVAALTPHRRRAPTDLSPAAVQPAAPTAEPTDEEVAVAPQPPKIAPTPTVAPVQEQPFVRFREPDVVQEITPVCQQYGTKVNFYDIPADATRLALKERKLLFVLHVAGNFEEPGFT